MALCKTSRWVPMRITSFPFVLLVWTIFSTTTIGAVVLSSSDHAEVDYLEPSFEQYGSSVKDASLQKPLSYEPEASVGSLDDTATILNSSTSYSALLDALHVMESHFFSVSQGTWPEAIDWTAAVMGTQVSASLTAMSEHNSLEDVAILHALDHENIINRYFTQLTAFYFGEDAFSLRTQAYDDMLWVVLGWIGSIKFINKHSNLHYARYQSAEGSQNWSASWYARQFIPQFAHRSHLFYDLASKGWDTTLCGGGMIWNPHLTPYKNAITNQLFIAASISMYLYFPGDDNPSPFLCPRNPTDFDARNGDGGQKIPPAKAHDERYMQNAIEAYKWLKDSGMRNAAGLYVDGFHISGWRGGRHGSNGSERCDLRDETVYTYNQGVILTALRGLWEATGEVSYLEDGHELIKDVIKATGWENRDTERRYQWAGLGRNGIMEERCDWSGMCSQDAQTFKGIFWHHFTVFCSPLNEDNEYDNSNDRPWLGDEETIRLHQESCDGYNTWTETTAEAAWITRDHAGEFGQWWGRPSPRSRPNSNDNDNDATTDRKDTDWKLEAPPRSDGDIDYRNEGVPIDETWRLTTDDHTAYIRNAFVTETGTAEELYLDDAEKSDLNDRGRGRTVETQSGGVAVMRALWKLMESRQDRKVRRWRKDSHRGTAEENKSEKFCKTF